MGDSTTWFQVHMGRFAENRWAVLITTDDPGLPAEIYEEVGPALSLSEALAQITRLVEDLYDGVQLHLFD